MVLIPKNERSKLIRLEALRGVAALYVFAGHVIIARLGVQHGLLSFVFRFGQEAVMLFFLLSGFVIFYSFSTGKDQTFKGYFRRRWLRIYPIFIFALFVTWILSGIRTGESTWLSLIGNLFMLQDFSFGKPGVWVDTFCGNSPLWSLSYEWWFYMMFYPLFTYIGPRKRRWVAIAIATAGLSVGLALPNQIARFALYFVIWWSGAEMARTYLSGATITFRSEKASLLALLAFTSVLMFEVLQWRQTGHQLMWGVHPFLEARHFAAALVLMVFGILWARWNWRYFDSTLGWCIWLAPISYGLYILHFPIAVNSHWQPASWNPILQTIMAIAAALAASCLAEFYLQPLAKRIVSAGIVLARSSLRDESVRSSVQPARGVWYRLGMAGVGIFGVGLAIYLSVKPSPSMTAVRWLPHFMTEWANHHGQSCNFPAYALLAMPFLMLSPRVLQRALVTASLAILVASMEIAQIWIPTRFADGWDIFWGWSGLLASWAAFEVVSLILRPTGGLIVGQPGCSSAGGPDPGKTAGTTSAQSGSNAFSG